MLSLGKLFFSHFEFVKNNKKNIPEEKKIKTKKTNDVKKTYIKVKNMNEFLIFSKVKGILFFVLFCKC